MVDTKKSPLRPDLKNREKSWSKRGNMNTSRQNKKRKIVARERAGKGRKI